MDIGSRARGPLHTVMAPQAVARDGTGSPAPDTGHNFSLEAGLGNRTMTISALVAVHDVTPASFSAGEGYLATTLGADLRWSLFRWHNLSPALLVGPVRMVLIDRGTGERTWGYGVRYGGGAQYRLGPVALYGEVVREAIGFDGGVAKGNTVLDGLTLGLAVSR